jgi:predicted metal-dependent HD superfamily phosphohydrolase
VYEPGATDNEARSAQWARSALGAAGCRPSAAERVHDLVLATRHDAPVTEPDAQLLVDLDLAILGAPPERFDEYEHQVRAEFAMVPVQLFRERRREILEGFLARERIYRTAPMHAAREQVARANLRRSIAALSR